MGIPKMVNISMCLDSALHIIIHAMFALVVVVPITSVFCDTKILNESTSACTIQAKIFDSSFILMKALVSIASLIGGLYFIYQHASMVCLRRAREMRHAVTIKKTKKKTIEYDAITGDSDSAASQTNTFAFTSETAETEVENVCQNMKRYQVTVLVGKVF